MNFYLDLTLQLIIGFVILLLVYIISIAVLRADSLYAEAVVNPNVKSKTAIVPGYVESSQIAHASYNTMKPFAANYLPLNPSSNIKGGAQFSYSLWIYVGQPNSALNKPIFLRGDANKYTFNITDKHANQTWSATDQVAFCPILEFGANPMEFKVRFNTNNNMNETLSIVQTPDPNSIYRKNLLSLFQARWFLITVVFEDNTPINDFENGLNVKFYINDILYESGTYAAMLKQNQGNLYLFPNGSVNQCKVSQLEYFNYAQGLGEIQAKYKAGPDTQPAALPTTGGIGGSVAGPLQLSEYNVLDIYNL